MKRSRRRGAMVAMELVMVLGVAFPFAAGMYWMFEKGIENFFFTFAAIVGSPYF